MFSSKQIAATLAKDNEVADAARTVGESALAVAMLLFGAAKTAGVLLLRLVGLKCATYP